MKAIIDIGFTDCAIFKKPKLTVARFPSWCIVIDDNVVVLDGKIPYESLHTLYFTHCAMI